MMLHGAHDISEEGFVLPYVLVAIAIISFALSLVGQRLLNTAELIEKVETRLSEEVALFSAESEAINAFLTSSHVPNGLDLNPREGFSFSANSHTSGDLWMANGGLKHFGNSGGSVLVEYRDGSGFIPLNTSNRNTLVALIESLGEEQIDANSLSAKLLDYMDEDNDRQEQGAEANEYIRKNMPPPTNSPIRSYSELSYAMDWDDFLKNSDMDLFAKRTTLSQKISWPRKLFLDETFIQEVDLKFESEVDVMGIYQSNIVPATLARFTIYCKLTNNKIYWRIIEVDKTISSLHGPFSVQYVSQGELSVSSEEGKKVRHIFAEMGE